MRFLLTRRWLLFGLAVLVMTWGAWRLGEWQFHRLHDREQRNEWTRTNLAAEPAPVDDVLSTLGYYMHEGRHGILPGDWPVFVEFLRAKLVR